MPPPGTAGTRFWKRRLLATSTPGVPGPPTNLCGERKTASFQATEVGRRAHLDPDVRRGGGEVEEGQRAVAVEQHRQAAGVREDAGHVGGGREAADLERALGVAAELALELREVDVAVRVLGDDHHVGDRLAPRSSLEWCS